VITALRTVACAGGYGQAVWDPSGYATAAEFDRMDEWTYEDVAPFTQSVTLVSDRVVAFTKPVRR
jgi:hypothetical protein